MVTTRLRIRFRKEGDLRLISHRDLVRAMERLFRRAELPLAMSQGFHPKPRMSFPSALAVGIASTQEIVEVELAQPASSQEVHLRLAALAPPGLVIDHLQEAPPGAKKVQVVSATYEIAVPPERQASAEASVSGILSAAECLVHRAGRDIPLDLKAELLELALDGSLLRIRLRVRNEGALRVREVLEVLGLADLEQAGSYLTRTQLEFA